MASIILTIFLLFQGGGGCYPTPTPPGGLPPWWYSDCLKYCGPATPTPKFTVMPSPTIYNPHATPAGNGCRYLVGDSVFLVAGKGDSVKCSLQCKFDPEPGNHSGILLPDTAHVFDSGWTGNVERDCEDQYCAFTVMSVLHCPAGAPTPTPQVFATPTPTPTPAPSPGFWAQYADCNSPGITQTASIGDCRQSSASVTGPFWVGAAVNFCSTSLSTAYAYYTATVTAGSAANYNWAFNACRFGVSDPCVYEESGTAPVGPVMTYRSILTTTNAYNNGNPSIWTFVSSAQLAGLFGDWATGGIGVEVCIGSPRPSGTPTPTPTPILTPSPTITGGIPLSCTLPYTIGPPTDILSDTRPTTGTCYTVMQGGDVGGAGVTFTLPGLEFCTYELVLWTPSQIIPMWDDSWNIFVIAAVAIFPAMFLVGLVIRQMGG